MSGNLVFFSGATNTIAEASGSVTVVGSETTLTIGTLDVGTAVYVGSGASVAATASAGWTAPASTTSVASGNDGTFTISTSGYNLDVHQATGVGGWTLIETGGTGTLTGSVNGDVLIAAGGLATMVGLSGADSFVVQNGAAAVVTDLGLGADSLHVADGGTLTATLAQDWVGGSQSSNAGTATIDLHGHNLDLSAVDSTWTITNSVGSATLTGLRAGDVLAVGTGATLVATAGSSWSAVAGSGVSGTIDILAHAHSIDLSADPSGTGSVAWIVDNAGSSSTILTGGSAAGVTYVLKAGFVGDTLVANGGLTTLIGGGGLDTFVVNSGTASVRGVNNADDALIVSAGATAALNLAADWTASAAVENDGAVVIDVGGRNLDLSAAVGGGSYVISATGGGTLAGSADGSDTFNVVAGSETLTNLGATTDVLHISAGATLDATLTADWVAGTASSDAGVGIIRTNGHKVDLTGATGTWTIVDASGTSTVACRCCSVSSSPASTGATSAPPKGSSSWRSWPSSSTTTSSG